MLPYCLELLVLTLTCLVACFCLGTALLRWVGLHTEEPFFALFLRLLCGVVGLTVGYALFRTAGVSILLPVPLLLGGVVLALRHSDGRARPAPVLTRPVLLMACALSLAVFIGQYVLVYEPGAPFLQTPFQDYVYYSRLTLMLNKLGLETNSLEVVFPQFQTEQPYHYFEIWLNALLVWATALPSVWVFFVSMAAVLLTICGIGFAAIYAGFGLRPPWAALLGGLTLTVNGTIWPWLGRYSFVVNGSLLSHLPVQLHPKLAPVYLAVLLVGLLLLRRRWVAASLAMGVLPLLFISTAPAVLAGAMGLALYLGLSRQLPWSRALRLLLPTGMVGMYIALFYALQPPAYQFVHVSHFSLLASVIPAGSELKTLVNIALGVMLNYGIYYLGYAAVGGALWWLRPASPLPVIPAGRAWLAWAMATLFGATLVRTLGQHFIDGFQFFSNPMVPVSAVVLAMVLGQLLRHATAPARAVAAAGLGGLLAVNVLQEKSENTRFSAPFLAQVGPVLRSLPNRGGYLLADADYQNAYMTASDSYTAGTYVSNFKNDYLLVSLSSLVPDSLNTDPRFARDSVHAAQVKRNSTLYRLAKLRHMAGHPLPADSLALALVQQAGLAFICASPRAKLPTSLWPLVRARYQDARSREVLYVLRPTVARPPIRVP
jgi:hypothetical protein